MTRRWLMTLLPLLMFSCGGGSAGTCGKVEPCGGSVVGSWKAAATCANSDFVTMSFEQSLMGSCASATASGFTVSQTGTATFNADMTYSVSIVDSSTVNFTIPASCNTSNVDCATFASYVQQASSAGTTVTCTGSGTCNCHLATTMPQTDSGTYTTTGTTITINSADGSSQTGDYCVQSTRCTCSRSTPR
jgi:hypothetical protein